MCCHPALAAPAQVALTLRCVCGLSTAEIAAASSSRRPPWRSGSPGRTRSATRTSGCGCPRGPRWQTGSARCGVVYLVFTEGHKAPGGPVLVRGELCDAAIRLARGLAGLLPGEPEVTGLLALLLLLTDARRPARTDPGGSLVLLAD